jgi:dTDP-4-dehydrorhamnose 3,5-epimerase
MELSGDKPQLLWVPPGFAHGFLVMSDVADVQYKCTELYEPSDERGIIWSDVELGIEWPDKSPKLSDRDGSLPTLRRAFGDLPRYSRDAMKHAAK